LLFFGEHIMKMLISNRAS